MLHNQCACREHFHSIAEGIARPIHVEWCARSPMCCAGQAAMMAMCGYMRPRLDGPWWL